MAYQPQHIVSTDGTPLVVITKDEYDRLVSLSGTEDAADIATARAALADAARYPAAVVDAMLAGDTPVRAWRKHRGITQAQLAREAGMTQSAVARLENDPHAHGRPASRKALAAALDVPVAALDPLD